MSATPVAGVRLAARLTAILLAAQVLLAIALPGWAQARWLHNLLTSAALACALAAALRSRGGRRQDPGMP